ncbi:unnamed protein product [Rotaria sordida]|nr:unnamed protein product [Rotaria sordida]
MNIDPVTWFDLKWRQCGDTEESQRECLAKVGLPFSFMQLLKNQTDTSAELETQKNFSIDQSRFIFTAKKEIIRDLVLFPMPPWHLSNRELIQLPLFWATAIIVNKMLHREL